MQKAAPSPWLASPRRSAAAPSPPRFSLPFPPAASALPRGSFPFPQAVGAPLRDNPPFPQAIGAPPRVSPPSSPAAGASPQDSTPFFQEEPDLVQTGSYFEICYDLRSCLSFHFLIGYRSWLHSIPYLEIRGYMWLF